MLFIYRFRRGFLRIEIRGDIAEALLNMCAEKRNTALEHKEARKRYQELYFGKRFQALARSCCGKRTQGAYTRKVRSSVFYGAIYKERLGMQPAGQRRCFLRF